MKLSIESTNQVTTIDGVPVRLWNGITENGKPCEVFVHLIGATPDGAEELDRELNEHLPPGEFRPFAELMALRLAEVQSALEESVKLQSHYAELLNMHDGGERMQFTSAAAWIDRLREFAGGTEL